MRSALRLPRRLSPDVIAMIITIKCGNFNIWNTHLKFTICRIYYYLSLDYYRSLTAGRYSSLYNTYLPRIKLVRYWISPAIYRTLFHIRVYRVVKAFVSESFLIYDSFACSLKFSTFISIAFMINAR